MQALSEMGVPVIAREGVNGGYALPDDYRLPPLPLSVHEIALLKFALSTLQSHSVTFGAARESLLSKLSAVWFMARSSLGFAPLARQEGAGAKAPCSDTQPRGLQKCVFSGRIILSAALGHRLTV